jgi:acetyl-CoA synthetase
LDPRHPDWLPGASFNIVASCLDHGDSAPAIIQGSAERIDITTVGEIKERVDAFAEGLIRSGIEVGDRVAIAMPMNDFAVVAYLAIVAAGAVVVSIADSFAPAEIAVRFAITEPAAVVTQDVASRHGKPLPMYAKVVEADGPRAIVVRKGTDSVLRDGDVWWDDFVVEGAVFEPVLRPASAHTNILFSSGTTGSPKAIPWSQTTPIKAAMDGRYHQDIHPGDVVAWPTNLGWMMGPWLIYASLLNGAAMALFDDAPTTREFVEFVRHAEITMLGLVPSIVAAWRAAGVLEQGDWHSVRVLSSTGEASNPDDYRWLMNAAGGVPVIEYCGGTEIGGGYVAGTVVHPAVASRFTTTTLGLDLVLLDDAGQESDVGEVFLIPPSIGLSTELLNMNHDAVYYEGVPHHDVQRRRHGDQFRRHADGTFQALGRVDDTMNLGGIKVASADIEGAIGDVEGIVELAAIASPTAGGGPDRLVIVVVPAEESVVDLEDLKSVMQQRIRSELNPLFRIHDIVSIGSLPRTASHKVMRRTLRAEYET